MTSVDPAANLARIAAELEAAVGEAAPSTPGVAGRSAPPRIVAVSKKHGADIIEQALFAGHRLFGENRVQEAAAKWPPLKARYRDITLHLIGPLQSNKAGEAVALFDVIETVDREKIARAIAHEIEKQGTTPGLYVQVNTGDEPQKSGVSPAEADDFVSFCQNDLGLSIDGLMCIPPADEPPAPHFALLAKIARRQGLPGLSMGMSADSAIAAQLGATSVRVGSGVFGPRPG